MKFNFANNRFISLIRKIYVLKFQYILGNFHIMRSDFIKALDIHFDCKLYFRHHVNIIFPNAIKLLELILFQTFYFNNRWSANEF
jgi:hypothetical protein